MEWFSDRGSTPLASTIFLLSQRFPGFVPCLFLLSRALFFRSARSKITNEIANAKLHISTPSVDLIFLKCYLVVVTPFSLGSFMLMYALSTRSPPRSSAMAWA